MQTVPVKIGLHDNALPLEPGGEPGCFAADLPAGAAGSWCRITVGLRAVEPWWAKLEATDIDRGHVVREAFLGRSRASRGGLRRGILMHLPASSQNLVVRMFTGSAGPAGTPWARLAVLSRSTAALAVLIDGWRVLPQAISGDLAGLSGRLRTMLGQAAARRGVVPPYAVWIRLYDMWGQTERDAFARTASKPSIAAIVVGSAVGREATLMDLRAQWQQPLRIVSVDQPADHVAGEERWSLVLQAGERLPPHALACFSHAASRWPDMCGFYADADSIAQGTDSKPLLKPPADLWLLGSGLLTSGGCLFRTSALVARTTAPDAAAWRRSLAQSAGAGALKRIPFVLTRLPDQIPVFRNPDRRHTSGALPSVSMIIPSAAKSRHVLRCIRKLVAETTYPNLEILVVSNVDPADAVQARVMDALARLPRVRIVKLDLASFNYSAVNNAAARQATGELLLLSNDDVVPVRGNWIQDLVGVMRESGAAQADIVGARLLYGNDTVQHGGVILGLANLCEHAFRLTTRDDPGPHGIATLDREVSAVTGACMLLRRSLYETLGGCDEAFAIALNDVDLCLRAGALGARIVIAAGVELYHYESLSLGRHYERGRAALEAIEVNRLRQRWSGAIADDPFYHPRASLMPGHEFEPAFPPRCTPLSWINGEMPCWR